MKFQTKAIVASVLSVFLLAGIQSGANASGVNAGVPIHATTSATYDAYKVRLASEVARLNFVGGERFDVAKGRMLKIAPTWKGKSYSGDWCAWSASFLLRGDNFANGKKIYATIATDVFRQIYNNKPLQFVFLSKASESDSAARKRLSAITLQPGDIVGYFGRRVTETGKGMAGEITNIKKFQNNPSTAGLAHFFDHVGVVVEPNKILEGNRCVDGSCSHLGIMFYKKNSVKFQWYGGMVIVRPEWK